MKEFKTIKSMAVAYAEHLNSSISHVGNKWTAQSVIDVCIKMSARPAMKVKCGVDAHCDVIEGFGYVVRPLTLEQKLELKLLKVFGKFYTCHVFKNEEDANKYMEKRPDLGVIAVQDGQIYLAKI